VERWRQASQDANENPVLTLKEQKELERLRERRRWQGSGAVRLQEIPVRVRAEGRLGRTFNRPWLSLPSRLSYAAASSLQMQAPNAYEVVLRMGSDLYRLRRRISS